MINLETTNLDLSDMDVSVLNCVNPYDVNPMSGGTIYEEQTKQIKLEMEEFSDLAPFLPKGTLKTMISSTDELNTPIFERKGPFNFMVSENPTYIESSPSATDPFKFEYDTIQMDSSVLSNDKLTDFTVLSNSNNNVSVQVQTSTNNSEVVNIVQGSEANLLFTTTESNQENIYILNNNNGNETPINMQNEDLSASIFKIEDTSVFSESNVSSPEYSMNTKKLKNMGIETPEDSNSSCESRKIPKLKLDIGLNQTVILNTPDVIDSVVDLETSFNILDYVNDKDVTTVNIEDIHFEDPSPSRELPILSPPLKLRKRKPKHYDDDEDYIPPIKSVFKKDSILSSDSDSEDELPKVKRGRPPRRTSSVSSDYSDANKYRELRDKNNEASRRSRLKRKMKELSLQKEADELYEKNVKLKAQVEEYEKMVNNFRSNLFKIMLKK